MTKHAELILIHILAVKFDCQIMTWLSLV